MGGFRDFFKLVKACQSDTAKPGHCCCKQQEQGLRPDGQISVYFLSLFLLFTINLWQIKSHQYKFPRQLEQINKSHKASSLRGSVRAHFVHLRHCEALGPLAEVCLVSASLLH